MELPTKPTNEHIDTLLRRSMAEYLYAIFNNDKNNDSSHTKENVQLNKNAFDEFILLIKYQLDDMFIQLNKLTLLQRRQRVAKDDLKLWLQQYNLDVNEMDQSLQLNNFLLERLKKNNKQAKDSTDNNNFVTKPDTLLDTMKIIEEQNLISRSLKVNNLNNVRLNNITKELKIFPNLPPDHTFKFTSQFNNIVTDERIIRQNLINESKKTETALSNLLSVNNNDTKKNEIETDRKNTDGTPKEMSIEEKEFIALFGPRDDILSKTIAKLKNNEFENEADNMEVDDSDATKYNDKHKTEESTETISPSKQDVSEEKMTENQKPNEKNPNDFSIYYNKRFNVVEYSMNRIKLARKMVKNYEINKIRRNYNPFINTTKKILNNRKGKEPEFTDSDRINLLRKSFNEFIDYTEKMQVAKKKILKDAWKEREIKMKKLREQLKHNAKNNLQSRDINNDNFDIINDTMDDDNLLFDELHSSDDDDEENDTIRAGNNNNLTNNNDDNDDNDDNNNNIITTNNSSTNIDTSRAANSSSTGFNSNDTKNVTLQQEDSNVVTQMNDNNNFDHPDNNAKSSFNGQDSGVTQNDLIVNQNDNNDTKTPHVVKLTTKLTTQNVTLVTEDNSAEIDKPTNV